MQKAKNAQILKIIPHYNITLLLTLLIVNLLLVKLYQFISIVAVASYFIPLVIVLLKKAWGDQFFRLFAIYWCVGGFVNMFDVIPEVPKGVIHVIGILYNMLDIPFILAILYHTTCYTFVKKTALAGIVMVLIVQVISLFTAEIDYDSQKYALGVGIAIVLSIVTMEIIRYMQKVEHSIRQNAKMFVYAAVLFEYATFIVIYIFDYILITQDRKDSFIIYYVSTLVAIMIASCGFLMYKRYERSAAFLQK
jgi:hypothetical protein